MDDKDTKKFSDFNIGMWRTLNKDIDKYQAKLDKLNKAKMAGTQTANQVKQEKLINDLLEKRTQELDKQRKSFSGGNWLQRKGAKMQAGAAAGGVMDLAGGALGGIGNAIGMMGPVGMVAGAGFGAYMGARALAAPRRALADENLKFMGLNKEPVSRAKLEELRQAGAERGYTAQESMQAANDLQRNVGNVKGRDEIQELFKQTRMTGMGAGEISGFAGTFRNAAIDEKGANLQDNLKKTGELYKQSMISALDTSGAIKFMQTTSEMISQVAEGGSADTKAITDTLTSLSLQSEFYKANASRGAAAFQGGEGFFKSEQGTGLAMRAMSGMKGVEGGAMGPMEMLATQAKGFSEKGGMGAKGLQAFIEQLISSATGVTKDNYGKATTEQKFGGANAIRSQYGISQTNAEALYKATMEGKPLTEKEMADLMTKEGKEGEAKMINLQTSMDQHIKNNEASLDNIMMKIGETIAPAMVSIEGMMYKLLNHMGVDAGPKSTNLLEADAKAAEKEANEERGGVWDTTKRLFGGGSEKAANEAYAEVAKNKLGEGKDLNFKEMEGFKKKLNPEGAMTLNPQFNPPEYMKSRRDELVSGVEDIDKNIEQRKKSSDYEHMDDKAKRSFDAKLTEENETKKDLTEAIKYLTKFLGDQQNPKHKLPGRD
ncbi:hypothetical protein CCP1ISM_330004 [Azospirillaceae bacterium]